MKSVSEERQYADGSWRSPSLYHYSPHHHVHPPRLVPVSGRGSLACTARRDILDGDHPSTSDLRPCRRWCWEGFPSGLGRRHVPFPGPADSPDPRATGGRHHQRRNALVDLKDPYEEDEAKGQTQHSSYWVGILGDTKKEGTLLTFDPIPG